MIDVRMWAEAASELAAEGFCMLMCLDRGAGAPLELWLRTNAGSVLVTTITDSPVPSVSHVWPEAAMKEREIHEMFGVEFDASHSPLLFPEGHPLQGVFPLLKTRALRNRNEVAWPGTKDPSDSGSSPSRRKSLPVGVVMDTQSFEGELI